MYAIRTAATSQNDGMATSLYWFRPLASCCSKSVASGAKCQPVNMAAKSTALEAKLRDAAVSSPMREALLAPTRIYVKALKNVKDAGIRIRGCSHITGGGFYENIPRMLPEGKRAVIRKDSYEIPAIFTLMQKTGGIEEQMMYNTYNMGVGMMIVVDPADEAAAIEALEAAGEKAFTVGEIKDGEKGVDLV